MQRTLELGDGRGQRRRGDVQLLRSGTDRARLRDRDECGELVHREGRRTFGLGHLGDATAGGDPRRSAPNPPSRRPGVNRIGGSANVESRVPGPSCPGTGPGDGHRAVRATETEEHPYYAASAPLQTRPGSCTDELEVPVVKTRGNTRQRTIAAQRGRGPTCRPPP